MTETIDAKAKVYEILKGFSTAMFVTTGPNGRPSARPMHVAQTQEEVGSICFLTGKDGSLVEAIAEDKVVLLVFQSEHSSYLSVRGEAKILRDVQRIKNLWKEPYKVWFPGGPEDPEIALIEVTPIDAEYWDNRGMNKLEYLFEAAKAYVKGERPDLGDKDQHGKAAL